MILPSNLKRCRAPLIAFGLTLALSTFSSTSLAQSKQQRAAALVPVIMMLLEQNGPIPLKVGRENTAVYTSDRYPDGIEFTYGRLSDDLRVTLNAGDIPQGAQVDVFVNGALVTTLSNGTNTFTIRASSAAENTITIRVRGGAEVAWRISRILGLLSNGPQNRAEAQRFLTRATFGPKLSEINRVLEIGYEAWLDEQIAIPQTFTLPFYDQAIIDRKANRRARAIAEGDENPPAVDASIGRGQAASSRLDSWYHAAINGKDQLRQRMAFALSQILVVGDERGDSSISTRAFAHYHDLLAREGLGNYRRLLKDVTINPAMANWLSLRGSQRAGRPGSRKSQPDENYAREVQQLFTIGLVELNMDGTAKRDSNNNEIETYTPELVAEFAKVFTGWNFPEREGSTAPVIGWEALPLMPWNGEPNTFHDYNEKTLHSYPGIDPVSPAGLTTEADLDRALDNLFGHSNVAPFISKQLIQRLVSSNPSPEYIERVARVFHSNNGVRGDLAAVAKAILLDPEALNSHQNPQGGKLKEPLLRYIQLWRTFDAKGTGRYFRYSIPERTTGQRPIGAGTVFNFYTPDYAPSGAIEDAGLVAPEFFLTGDGLLISYLNDLSRYIQRDDFGDSDPSLYSGAQRLPIVLNLSEAKSHADDFNRLMNFMNERLFGGLMSTGLRNRVIEFLETELPPESNRDLRRDRVVKEALILLTASAEYSVQR